MNMVAAINASAASVLDAQAAELEEVLIERARALGPTLRARAAETESLRHIPEATEADFRAAGFYKALQPRQYGGYELAYGAHTMIAAEIARNCVSSAWAYSVTSCHSWILGMFPAQAQADLWSQTPDGTVASSFLPAEVKLERAEGGYRVSGRWRFSSNVNHCQACILLIMVPQEGQPPKQYFALLLADQYTIEDTWNVVGLTGSGSNDVLLDGAFVPDHRLLDVMTTREAQSPGGEHNEGDLYNMPLFAPFAHSLVGAAVGGAQGALDVVLEELVDRRSAGQVPLAQQQSVQMRVAEATAEIEAAKAVLAVDRMKIVAASRARELPTYEQRVKYRLNTGYAAKLAVQAVERLLPLAGGRGLERTHPLQRAWRDVHAVAQHIALVWDVQALNYGSVRLGFKAMDPRI